MRTKSKNKKRKTVEVDIEDIVLKPKDTSKKVKVAASRLLLRDLIDVAC